MKKKSSKAQSRPKNMKKDAGYTHFEDYICTQTFRQIPMSQAGLLHLANTLIEWSKKRDSYILYDFLDHYGVAPKTFYAWVKKSDCIKAAHEFAMRRIASNREIGALTKKLDVGPFKHVQHRYDDAWREADEYHSRLKAKETKETNAGYIVIRDMPASDLVPVRTDKLDTGEDQE